MNHNEKEKQAVQAVELNEEELENVAGGLAVYPGPEVIEFIDPAVREIPCVIVPNN